METVYMKLQQKIMHQLAKQVAKNVNLQRENHLLKNVQLKENHLLKNVQLEENLQEKVVMFWLEQQCQREQRVQQH